MSPHPHQNFNLSTGTFRRDFLELETGFFSVALSDISMFYIRLLEADTMDCVTYGVAMC